MSTENQSPDNQAIESQSTLTGLFSQDGGQGSPFGGTPAAPPPKPQEPPRGGEGEAADLLVGEADKKPVEPDTDRSHEFSYDPTGNASLDYALSFVGDLGYGPQHPAILAAQEGNFHLIAAELAREGVRGADQVIALAKEAYEQEKGKVESQKAELTKFAYETAGGPDNWKQVQSWASTNATPQEKQQINALLASGGFAAQSAINFLVAQYSKVNTLSRTPTRVAKPSAGGARGQDVGGAISAQEYGQLVQQLIYTNGGRDVSHTREYQDLQARRLAGRRAGL